MSLELWPQITYPVLAGWGLQLGYKDGRKAFIGKLQGTTGLTLILYFGEFFDTMIDAIILIFGGHYEV